jgi:hypothetical protein
MTNLAGDPAYQGQVLAYAQKMLSWRMNQADQTLTNMALTDDGLSVRASPRY